MTDSNKGDSFQSQIDNGDVGRVETRLSNGQGVGQVTLAESVGKVIEDVIHSVFEERRETFVRCVTERIQSVVGEGGITPGESVDEEDWIVIESLSRLRSVVGGRFQNIRKKWLEAGLPLREHRGDKKEDYAVDHEGWVELSNWILKQGYEARLTPDKTGCVIELRKRA